MRDGGRITRLRSDLEERGLGCMVVSKIENVRYLSGFSGSSAVALLTPERSVLFTDPRYEEQASGEAAGWELRIHSGKLAEALAAELPRAVSCGFESSCTFQFYERLNESVGEGTELVPVEGAVERLRVVKDEGEIELIRAAVRCATAGFEALLAELGPGRTERELAALLDYRMVLAGADSPAFDTVLASGPNASLPHAPVTDRALRAGEEVIIDFGASRRGYRSDTTRTVSTEDGAPGELYDVVAGALDAALASLAPGAKAADVDSVARRYISDMGYGERFGHSLGHGVGLETHEAPTLSSQSSELLEAGMVFTVEPGVYLPGKQGVRIEEMVLMTPEGPEVLTRGIPHRVAW